ncbi:ORF3 [Silurid herpesvirus 1]|nr:ORF3 [Silurid herpesvirus 1]AVP72253.1 ORF3 [Silurid herpesvirus 1]
MASNQDRAPHVHWCLQLFSELGSGDDDQTSLSGSSLSGTTPDWVSAMVESSDDDLSSMASPVSDRTSGAFSWASDDEGDDDVFEDTPGGSWSERTVELENPRAPRGTGDEVTMGVVEKLRLVREEGVWRVAEREVRAPTPYPWANPEEPDQDLEALVAEWFVPASPSNYSPPSPVPDADEWEFENPPSPTDYSPTSPRYETRVEVTTPVYSPINSPEWDYEAPASPTSSHGAATPREAEPGSPRGFHLGPLLSNAWNTFEEYANEFIMEYRTLYHPHRDTPYSPAERRGGETPHGPCVPESPVAGPSRKRGRTGETRGAPPMKRAPVEDWDADLDRRFEGYTGAPITAHDLLPATVGICPVSNCFFSGLKPEISGPTMCKCAICKHDGQCLCLARCARNCPDYECTCVDIATDNGRDPTPVFEPEDTCNFFIDECLANGMTQEVADDLFCAKNLAFRLRNETRLKELDNA